nr:hypothetical protein [Tanacetum cinerariifolium]
LRKRKQRIIGPNPTNNTNSFNTASPSDTDVSPNVKVDKKYSFVDLSNYLDDPDIPALEAIVYSDDEEDVGVVADLSNLETSISVSLILTTRVYKGHHVTQIIGDLTSTPQTRSMTRMNPRKYTKYSKILVGLNPFKKSFFNLNCKRFRNKARVVAQRHTQEKGIDYDEVFAPVARIEAIWLFLAYASFMGFMVYQMDVKSAFLYATIKEEVYVYQPPGFKESDYPDKVYKVVKGLYGLHQAPRAWYETLANYLLENGFQRGKIDQTLFIKNQKGYILLVQQKDDRIFISQDKHAAEILRKFGFTDVKSASTPIETEKPLHKDPDGEDVDVHIYRYLKGKPHLGLWYHKDSPFNLVAYSECDYAGASLDRKSTTEDNNFADLLTKAFDVGRFQYLVASTTIKKVNNVVQLRALIDAKKVVVTEDVVRQDLCLDNANGVKCLPNEKIFAELARMGYETPPPKLIAKRTAWNEFSCSMASAVICLAIGVESPLFATMLVQPQTQPTEEEEEDEEQPTKTFESFIPLLNTLLESCATLSQKVTKLEQDKDTQALEILKLKKMVKELEKKNKSMSLGLKRLRKVGTSHRVESSADTVVDVDTQVDMDAKLQGRIDQDVSAATKDVSAAKPTVIDDKKEIEKAAAREKQEKDDLERAKVLEQQYDDKEENIDWNIAANKFKKSIILGSMTYDKVKHIFEREYKKVQTLFKLDKDVEELKKKRVAEETLLQESFKKLKVVKVSGSESTQETPSNDPKELSKQDV